MQPQRGTEDPSGKHGVPRPLFIKKLLRGKARSSFDIRSVAHILDVEDTYLILRLLVALLEELGRNLGEQGIA